MVNLIAVTMLLLTPNCLNLFPMFHILATVTERASINSTLDMSPR